MLPIKALRQSKGLSQAELAALLNVHQTAVSQWEKGRTTPDLHLLTQMADLFGVTTDYLLGRTAESAYPGTEAPLAEDEFMIAFSGEVRELSSSDKELLLNMVKTLRQQRKQENQS